MCFTFILNNYKSNNFGNITHRQLIFISELKLYELKIYTSIVFLQYLINCQQKFIKNNQIVNKYIKQIFK